MTVLTMFSDDVISQTRDRSERLTFAKNTRPWPLFALSTSFLLCSGPTILVVHYSGYRIIRFEIFQTWYSRFGVDLWIYGPISDRQASLALKPWLAGGWYFRRRRLVSPLRMNTRGRTHGRPIVYGTSAIVERWCRSCLRYPHVVPGRVSGFPCRRLMRRPRVYSGTTPWTGRWMVSAATPGGRVIVVCGRIWPGARLVLTLSTRVCPRNSLVLVISISQLDCPGCVFARPPDFLSGGSINSSTASLTKNSLSNSSPATLKLIVDFPNTGTEDILAAYSFCVWALIDKSCSILVLIIDMSQPVSSSTRYVWPRYSTFI